MNRSVLVAAFLAALGVHAWILWPLLAGRSTVTRPPEVIPLAVREIVPPPPPKQEVAVAPKPPEPPKPPSEQPKPAEPPREVPQPQPPMPQATPPAPQPAPAPKPTPTPVTRPAPAAVPKPAPAPKPVQPPRPTALAKASPPPMPAQPKPTAAAKPAPKPTPKPATTPAAQAPRVPSPTKAPAPATPKSPASAPRPAPPRTPTPTAAPKAPARTTDAATPRQAIDRTARPTDAAARVPTPSAAATPRPTATRSANAATNLPEGGSFRAQPREDRTLVPSARIAWGSEEEALSTLIRGQMQLVLVDRTGDVRATAQRGASGWERAAPPESLSAYSNQVRIVDHVAGFSDASSLMQADEQLAVLIPVGLEYRIQQAMESAGRGIGLERHQIAACYGRLAPDASGMQFHIERVERRNAP